MIRNISDYFGYSTAVSMRLSGAFTGSTLSNRKLRMVYESLISIDVCINVVGIGIPRT